MEGASLFYFIQQLFGWGCCYCGSFCRGWSGCRGRWSDRVCRGCRRRGCGCWGFGCARCAGCSCASGSGGNSCCRCDRTHYDDNTYRISKRLALAIDQPPPAGISSGSIGRDQFDSYILLRLRSHTLDQRPGVTAHQVAALENNGIARGPGAAARILKSPGFIERLAG